MGDVIRNKDFARQLYVFEGLKWDTISPTDVDVLLDFKGRLFVFIEIKYRDSKMPGGQELALRRLCDACDKAGVTSVVLVASHATNGDIQIRDLPVTGYRYKGKWINPREIKTVKEAVEEFLKLSGLGWLVTPSQDAEINEWLKDYESSMAPLAK